MSAANDRDVQARRHRRIAKRLNAIKDSVEEISDAVEKIRDAIKLRYGGVNVSGGFVLYVLIGIGWGIGVASKSDIFTGAWSGLIWPAGRMQCASTLYLAYQIKAAARSSEKYARWLFYATGALVLATLVLAVVQAVTIYKGP